MRECLPLNSVLTDCLDWLANELRGCSCLYLFSFAPLLGFRYMLSCLAFYLSSGDPNSGLHACMAGTLLSHFPSSSHPFSFSVYIHMCMSVCMPLEVRGKSQVLSLGHCPHFCFYLETGSHTGLELNNRPGWSSKPQVSSCLCLPKAGLASV